MAHTRMEKYNHTILMIGESDMDNIAVSRMIAGFEGPMTKYNTGTDIYATNLNGEAGRHHFTFCKFNPEQYNYDKHIQICFVFNPYENKSLNTLETKLKELKMDPAFDELNIIFISYTNNEGNTNQKVRGEIMGSSILKRHSLTQYHKVSPTSTQEYNRIKDELVRNADEAVISEKKRVVQENINEIQRAIQVLKEKCQNTNASIVASYTNYIEALEKICDHLTNSLNCDNYHDFVQYMAENIGDFNDMMSKLTSGIKSIATKAQKEVNRFWNEIQILENNNKQPIHSLPFWSIAPNKSSSQSSQQLPLTTSVFSSNLPHSPQNIDNDLTTNTQENEVYLETSISFEEYESVEIQLAINQCQSLHQNLCDDTDQKTKLSILAICEILDKCISLIPVQAEVYLNENATKLNKALDNLQDSPYMTVALNALASVIACLCIVIGVGVIPLLDNYQKRGSPFTFWRGDLKEQAKSAIQLTKDAKLPKTQ